MKVHYVVLSGPTIDRGLRTFCFAMFWYSIWLTWLTSSECHWHHLPELISPYNLYCSEVPCSKMKPRIHLFSYLPSSRDVCSTSPQLQSSLIKRQQYDGPLERYSRRVDTDIACGTFRNMSLSTFSDTDHVTQLRPALQEMAVKRYACWVWGEML